MRLGPRARLVLLMALFAVPIVASVLTYRFMRPATTANYGELLLPPGTLGAAAWRQPDGRGFDAASVAGRWVLLVRDAAACDAACVEKLTTLRQVRLALGREASRVARVWLVEGAAAPEPAALAPFEGTIVARAAGPQAGASAAFDRAHIYLADPHGNVMMRWPAAADRARLLKDLQRLLKASQIG